MPESQVAAATEADRLPTFLERVPKPPPLPRVAQNLLRVSHDPSARMQTLVQILTADRRVSSRVLGAVNSSAFPLPCKANSLHHAVSLLSLETVRQLCIGISIMRLFIDRNPEPAEETARLWKHALAVGLTARAVAKRLHHPQSETLFTAGLLHDIGHVILLENAEKELRRALEKAQEEHSSILDAEASVFGFDHRHVGEWLASEWRLPRIFQIAIARHHDPESYAWESEAEQRAIAMVALADEAAHFRGISLCRAQPTIDLPDTLSYLELEADEVTELTEELAEDVRAFYSSCF